MASVHDGCISFVMSDKKSAFLTTSRLVSTISSQRATVSDQRDLFKPELFHFYIGRIAPSSAIWERNLYVLWQWSALVRGASHFHVNLKYFTTTLLQMLVRQLSHPAPSRHVSAIDGSGPANEDIQNMLCLKNIIFAGTISMTCHMLEVSSTKSLVEWIHILSLIMRWMTSVNRSDWLIMMSVGKSMYGIIDSVCRDDVCARGLRRRCPYALLFARRCPCYDVKLTFCNHSQRQWPSLNTSKERGFASSAVNSF